MIPTTPKHEPADRPVRHRSRPLSRSFAIVALLSGIGFLAACTPQGSGGGGGTTTPPPTDYSECPTPGPGQVRVATVVEGTGLAGFDQPEVVCVVVAQGANGLSALNARAARLGVPAARLNGSGLMCAIGGLPAAPACGDIGPSGAQYWSYWLPNGSGGWTYGPTGPASRSMQEGTVEGWRWVPGGANTSPTHTSSFSSLVDI